MVCCSSWVPWPACQSCLFAFFSSYYCPPSPHRLLLLISYSSFLTTTTATRPSALLSLSLSTVITLRARHAHNSRTVNSAGTGFPIPLTFDVRNQAKVETFAAPLGTDDTDDTDVTLFLRFRFRFRFRFDLRFASFLRISNLHDACKDACHLLILISPSFDLVLR